MGWSFSKSKCMCYYSQNMNGKQDLNKASKKGYTPFLKMINIDVRGKIEVIVTGINVILNLEIGEIKRSESNDIIKHGFVQLCWRLAVIGYALDILFPNIKCTLIRALIILLDTFLYKNERRVETKKWTKAFE
ncbi:unnamed protein product [Rhizophagus irregularis]|nr:unnamed protein product [Rhizophagus irregularis]